MKKNIYNKGIGFLLVLALLTSCENFDLGSKEVGSDGSGAGGSMARFTIAGDYLYTVDDRDLKVFDVTEKEKPVFVDEQEVGFGVETIFPMDSLLFLGTTSGMYIFSLDDPSDPNQISHYEHVVSCDPVVSDGEYAYVTLSNLSERCWRGVNELHIIDLENIESPKLLKQYEMAGPRGLAIKNDTLWVCDDGLKVYDASDVMNIKELFHFNNLMAYDIILDGDRAIVMGETGLVQYQLENGQLIKLSEIKVGD